MKNKRIFLIILIVFFLYFPSLFFNFSYFDDQVLILESLNFLKDIKNIGKIFLKDVFFNEISRSYYRPILTLSLMIDTQFSGASPFFYHLSNVVYHLIASLLVFIFLKKIKIDEKNSFLLSLFFLVHPVLTQAVSWIPGRNDSLLAIFALSSFIFLINYLEKRTFFNLFFYFLFFTLALLTKESALLIPLFNFFFIIYFYQQKRKYLLEIFFGWWFIVFFWLILRQRALNNFLYLSFQEIIRALFFNSPAVLVYFGKIFFPFNLSVLPILKDSNLLWGTVALMFFVLLTVYVRKINWKLFIFGLSWFVLFLIPNFIRPNTSITADFLEHRIYLPLVGFLMTIISFEKINRFLVSEKGRFFYLLIIFLGSITFFHQFKFKNRLIFWENAVKSSPHSSLAHRNYGVMLYFEKRIIEAEKHYRESLKINPKEPMVHNNLGVIYLAQKKFNQAEKEFLKELKINPYYDNALYNLGLVYYQKKDYKKAEDHWKKTLLVNPNYLSAYKSLSLYYLEKKDHLNANYYWQIYKAKGGD